MNTTATFPMVVALAPRFVNHLEGCEWGSYEDHGCGKEQRFPGSPHICDIIKRRKSGIEIRSVEEVQEVYYALASGTFQLAYEHGQGFRGALREARRICDLLRPMVTHPDALCFTPDGN